MAHPQPKLPPLLGSSPRLPFVDAPYGLARLGVLKRLNTSIRNSAPNRSLNLKSLNTEKSRFLKPESRKVFRPMVPKVPATGGTRTELPTTKQPPLPAVSVVMSGATLHALASDEGSVVCRVLIPDVVEQATFVRSAPPLVRKSAGKLLQKGMELELGWKSLGLPKKSQRSVTSPSVVSLPKAFIMLKAFCVSYMDHGWELCTVRMVLSFQPSSNGLRFLCLTVRSHSALSAEALFLRKQLAFYEERETQPRRLNNSARLSLVLWSHLFHWKSALVIVKPETLIGWHRRGFKLFWKWRSRVGRPRLPDNIRKLIIRMALENPTWGQARVAA